MDTNLRALILGALAAGSLGGCSTWNCKPDSEDFSLDETITEGDVRDVLTYWGYSERSDIGCETFCAFKYEQLTGWDASSTSCSVELDDEAGSDAEDAVGSVQCAGVGYEYLCEGRRPLGHVEQTAPSPSESAGDYLAACAHLEAASITAFDQLARQLSAWGAPEALVERCTVAAREEARHAQVVGALARAHGAPALPSPEAAPASADLLSVALHNAVEGCVHEAWAALAAHWKADHAHDGAVRAAYRDIAGEEVGHAQLAWDLHRWLLPHLSAAERQRVVDAQQAALARLPDRALDLHGRLPSTLGRPPAQVVHAAAVALQGALLAAGAGAVAAAA